MYLVALLLLLVVPATGLAFDGRVVTGAGKPVARAAITILGHTGVARTDAGGRFTWTVDPAPPFEVLVIAPGGVYMKPMWGEELTRDHLERAGFRSIVTHRLAHDIQNNWYVVTK